MKIVTTILIVLLVITLGGGAYFYLVAYKPMALEYDKLRAGQPEFEKARTELKMYKAREKQETAWIGSAMETLKRGLGNEIAAGKAEVVAAGSRVIINIAEGVLYTPMSVTFARDSQQALATIANLLKDMKDKEIVVGNATQSAPAQGKGRKRIPAKDARTLAAGRSVELAKYLEKNGVPAEALTAAAYPSKQPDRGFKIKENKTIIVITASAAAAQEPSAPRQETKPAPATKTTVTTAPTASVTQPKSIPISTVPPKKTS
jgi:outer membrane protein OmpA-like peptidoglycan-associated protein